MQILTIVIYIVAILSYLGFILFGVFGLIHAYRTYRRDSEVFHTSLYDYLTSINAKLDNIQNECCDKPKRKR